MNVRPLLVSLATAATAAIVAGTTLSYAQSVSLSRSTLPDQPFTLIYPDTMQASGGVDRPLIINHASAPLQCSMTYVPVEETTWVAEDALASLVDADVEAGWREKFPGFTLTSKGTTTYQSNPALIYEGTSTDSPMGMPLTIVHTETVAGELGYTLDCLFDTTQAEQARPIVDFIIANFSTSAEAECCVPISPAVEAAPAQ